MQPRHPSTANANPHDSSLPDEPPIWTVWRQDDSGCKYVLEAHLTEERARALVAEFEARGHKQTFWCTNDENS